MLLVIDIGNSDITLGLNQSDKWIHTWRIPSALEQPEVFYALRLHDYLFESRLAIDDVQQVVISSVVPDLTAKLQHVCATVIKQEPIVLGAALYRQLPIKILNPYEIGSDLVANALAAYLQLKRSCVVVDFGTALTFTVISTEGEILGVAIAPGLKTAIKSLSQNTAKLFDVPLVMPASVLGKGTVHAIQAGVLMGYEGMVKHMLQTIRQEVGDDQLPAIATGGLSSIIQPLQKEFVQIDPYLTLNGLRAVANLYKKSATH